MYNNINYPSIDMIRSRMDQVMVVPELSLGLNMSIDQKSSTSASSLTSDQSSGTARSLKKRKSFNDHVMQTNNKSSLVAKQSLDDIFLRYGQVKRDRLPVDWEQCLDLNSGKIYFLNRKTAEKVWDRPTTDNHHQQNNEKPFLELELNISSPTSSSTHSSNSTFKLSQKITSLNDHQHKPTYSTNDHPNKTVTGSRTTSTIIPTTSTTTSCVAGSNNMVALACSNCHLLVILSKSSPSCPNCKYVHYLHSTVDQHDFKEASPNRTMKPINTLSLFS